MSSPHALAVQGIQDALNALYAVIGSDVPDGAIRPLAAQFAQLDDDQQAQFFIEVARIMETWGAVKRGSQAYFIGRHLATCTCSTLEARELIRDIAAGMDGTDDR